MAGPVYLTPSLFDEAKSLELEIDTHCSDLYIKITPESKRLIEKHKSGWSKMATRFRSEIDGCIWFDIPFGYPHYKRF